MFAPSHASRAELLPAKVLLLFLRLLYRDLPAVSSQPLNPSAVAFTWMPGWSLPARAAIAAFAASVSLVVLAIEKD